MTAPTALFQRALHAWVLLFLVTSLPVAGLLWLDPVSPLLRYSGWRYDLVHPLGSWLPVAVAPGLVVIAIGLAIRGVWRARGAGHAVLLWFAYTALMHLAFAASSGGQQLVSNLLFLNVMLSLGGAEGGKPATGLRAWCAQCGWWAIRLQLLVAYVASGLHKLSGTAWVEGAAMGMVTTDPAFGPSWLAGSPLLPGLTWLVLGFQLTFPLAVWWRPARLAWLLFGVGFHLGTALWMDLPDMGTAFLVAYVPWLQERELRSLPVRWRATLGTQAAS